MVETLATHPRQVALSSYMMFFQLPGVAERAVRSRNFALLEQLWQRWSPRYDATVEDLQALRTAFRVPGVVPASLSYYRALFAVTRPENQAARALLRQPLDLPVLGLCGLDDGCIAADVFAHAMERAPYSHLVVEQLAGLGHFLHLEAPARVSERIVRFLRTALRATPRTAAPPSSPG